MTHTTRSRVFAACAAATIVVSLGAGGAAAANKIDGHDIKQSTVGYQKLTEGLRKRIDAPGAPGAPGARGETGAKGATGVKGVSGLQGEKGNAGPKGDTGDKGRDGIDGKDGANGNDGVSGYEVVVSDFVWAPAGEVTVSRAMCPSGKVPIGGGFGQFGGINDERLALDASSPEEHGWVVAVAAGADSRTFVVRAICATAN